MEINLTKVINAPVQKLWDMLLDPQAMSGCVPGMQSVEVISDREYLAEIKVKIAFISARFKVRTVITEMSAPKFLRAESTGEDSSVGSSVKSVSEMTLVSVDDGRTELTVSVKATVLGRLGTLGLNPMKTKAERMWEEFCAKLEEKLAAPVEPDAAEKSLEQVVEKTVDVPETASVSPQISTQEIPPGVTGEAGVVTRLYRKIFGGETIRVELRRGETAIVLLWPADHAEQCLSWLDRQLDRG